MPLLKGPELRTHYCEDREEKKAQHQVGFEPATSLLRGMRSTPVLQPLPMSLFMRGLRSTELAFLLPNQQPLV